MPVTIHLALREAIDGLSSAAIVHAGRVVDAALRRDFAIAAPVIAVAGLNPHAGEAGALGREEIDIIAPAIAALRAAGIDARGPLAADTLFHAAARRGYDAALCMYHDQALIPIKTLDFDGGVNVTLGLPFIRTSPDHGTAFDIAGKGVARPDSLIAALRLAAEMAARRSRTLSDRASARRCRRCARSSRATASPRARASGRISARSQPDAAHRARRRPARPPARRSRSARARAA